MSTENILLNSSALNSLKRPQLVGLCKRYGLRANGKNTELIARLQEYGRSGAMADILGHKDDVRLQGDEAESVAETNNDGGDDGAPEPQLGVLSALAPRPSEAWSVVDEPLGVEANVPGGLPAIHEFGDADKESKKSSSVSSSFKLLAASLFAGSSARSKASVPPSVVEPQPPEPRPFADTMQMPLEVDHYEPDVDMELNTSVSTILKEEIDLGASTIRLVGPLKGPRSASPPTSPEYANPSPFKGKSLIGLPSSSSQLHLPLPFASSTINLFGSSTSHNFSKSTPPELMMGSSGSKPLYPSLNPSMRSLKTMTSDSFSIPGTFPQPPVHPYPAYASSSPKESKPIGIPTSMNPDFTFRSPLPKVADSETDKDFAKAAILAEMRRRMAEEPNPTANATLGEFSFVAVPAPVGGGAKKRGREDRDDEASETKEDTSATSVAAKFDRVHRKQFDKMASIADHYAARRPNPSPRKSKAGRPSSNGYPRARTSLIGNRASKRHSTVALRLSAAKAAGARQSTLNPDERPGKRARISSVSTEETVTVTKPAPAETTPTPRNIRISEPANNDGDSNRVDLTAETKRKVDAASATARARRKSRSSLGRQSLSRNAVLGSHPTPKPKGLASRFGFLKSSAKLVKSVYTSVIGGGGSETTKNESQSAKLRKTAPLTATPRTTTAAQPSKPSPRSSTKPQPPASRPSYARGPPPQFPAPPVSKLQNATARSATAAPNTSGVSSGIVRKVSDSSRPRMPAWSGSLKPAASAARAPSHSTNSASSRLSRIPSVGAASTLRSEMSPATGTPASSIGLKRGSSVRSSNSFAAPTISSLARASAKAKSLEQAQAQSSIQPTSISSRMALLESVPEHQHQQKQVAAAPDTPRATTASPNKFGFSGRSSASPQKPITTSRFVLSPPNSAPAKQISGTTQPPTTPSYKVPGEGVGSPAPAGRSARNNDPATLSPRENLSFSALQNDVDKTPVRGGQSSVPTAPAPLLPRSTSNASSVRTSSTNQSLRKRPRISRSKVIAKLDQKRAAEDAVNMVRVPSLRFKGRTRSSVGVGLASDGNEFSLDAKILASRRSFVTNGTGSPRASSGLARKERAALESFQYGQKKGEAAARLKRTSHGLVPVSRVIAEQGEDE